MITNHWIKLRLVNHRIVNFRDTLVPVEGEYEKSENQRRYALKKVHRLLSLLLLGLLVSVMQAGAQTLPQFGHVTIVLLENTDYSSSVGSMPYLDSLVAKYGLATNYYADTHPSIGNYFTLTTGQILTNDDGQLIIVCDESSGSGGTNSTGTTAGGQVECVIVSPNIVSAGFKSTTRHYHESLLRLMEQGLGLTAFAGSSASANNMSEFFGAGTLPGVVSLSPTAVPFGSVTVGTTSAAQVVTLHNGTTSSASISSIAISGTNASAFAQTHTCGSSLAAGASCTISVTFKPAATGAAAATLTVADSATGSPRTAALTGAGVTSTVSLSPASLTFANQAVGTTSAAQFSTLTNSGSTTITISGMTITGTNSGDFTQTHTCGASLAAGTSCTIGVTFKPTATGSRSAGIAVTDNAGGSPQTAALSGSGVSSGTTGPVASLSPTSLAFGNQTVGTTSAAKVVTLSNTGSAALSISGIAIAGTNSADFTQTHTCLSSLAAGTSCTISVTFKPAATGTRSASVSVAGNGRGRPQGA